MVAMLQGGGVWKDSCAASLLQSPQNTHHLQIDKSYNSAIQQPSVPEDDTVPAPVKKRRVESYLCTGYDLFTTHEPCTMYVRKSWHSYA